MLSCCKQSLKTVEKVGEQNTTNVTEYFFWKCPDKGRFVWKKGGGQYAMLVRKNICLTINEDFVVEKNGIMLNLTLLQSNWTVKSERLKPFVWWTTKKKINHCLTGKLKHRMYYFFLYSTFLLLHVLKQVHLSSGFCFILKKITLVVRIKRTNNRM